MRVLSALILSSATLLGACHHGGGAIPVKMEVRGERVAIRSHGVDGNIFRFSVENLSNDAMVLNRDAVRLETSTGPRERMPGGLEHEYALPPHGVHGCDLRFPLEGLPSGAEVRVNFSSAITVGGQPVTVEPIPFSIK